VGTQTQQGIEATRTVVYTVYTEARLGTKYTAQEGIGETSTQEKNIYILKIHIEIM
jgi:hypothetical protein